MPDQRQKARRRAVNKPTQREAPVLKAVGDYLKSKGYLYMRVNRVRIAGKQGKITFIRHSDEQKGWADFIVYGRFVLSPDIAIECKSSIGKLSRDQIKFSAQWIGCGYKYLLVRPENWLEELQRVGL